MVHLSYTVEQGLVVGGGTTYLDVLGEYNFSRKVDITIGILTKVETVTQPLLKIIKIIESREPL